jgi:hypothetical protein
MSCGVRGAEQLNPTFHGPNVYTRWQLWNLDKIQSRSFAGVKKGGMVKGNSQCSLGWGGGDLVYCHRMGREQSFLGSCLHHAHHLCGVFGFLSWRSRWLQ